MGRPDEEEAARLRADPEPRARDVIALGGPPALDPARRWEQMRQEDFSLPLYVQLTMRTQLDPADWNTGFLAVHERELPPQLYADLRELSPQASLRDLYRPVEQFFATPAEIEGSRLVGLWRDGAADAAAARRLEPLPRIDPAVNDVIASQARRRAFLGEPWKPILDDAAPRKKVQLHPDMSMWEEV